MPWYAIYITTYISYKPFYIPYLTPIYLYIDTILMQFGKFIYELIPMQDVPAQ